MGWLIAAVVSAFVLLLVVLGKTFTEIYELLRAVEDRLRVLEGKR